MEDERKLWSSVGSAGILDVADQGKVVFYNSIVQLGAAGLTGVATEARAAAVFPPTVYTHALLRYGVTAVDGDLHIPREAKSYTSAPIS